MRFSVDDRKFLGSLDGPLYRHAVQNDTKAQTPRPGAEGMLDEPSLSRQWVARRLQRALSVERWCGSLREGFARNPAKTGKILLKHATSAKIRALRLESLIRETGSEPYGSWGLGFTTARFGGWLLARLNLGLMRRAAKLVAEHTLSEYETLEAFVQDAPGIDNALSEAIEPMHAQLGSELDELGRTNNYN